MRLGSEGGFDSANGESALRALRGERPDHGNSARFATSDVTSQFFLNADARSGTYVNGLPSFTIQQAAAHIDRDGYSWSGDGITGVAAVVSYAFRATAPFAMPDDTRGFTKFNAQQIEQAELALQSWADVANLTFVRVNQVGYSNDAEILFGNYGSGADGAAAFAYYPSQWYDEAGDVWVNSSLSYNADPQPLDYGRLVLTHETGHAIGLGHPGDYNAGTGNPTYADADYYEDTLQYTVMSYWSESNTGADFFGYYPAAPLLDDIAAAQRIYGANMTTRTGNTVYGFHSNSGRDFYSVTSAASPLIFAVWDAGGVDTLDFSGYSDAQVIDLREGFFSSVGGLTGNVAIALGVTIENAVGGSGADAITGNAVANVLEGGAGNDALVGAAGVDTASYSLAAKAVAVSLALAGAQNTGGAGTDTLASIENLTGSKFADALTGNGGANVLNGGAGADTLKGGLGNDIYVVDTAGDRTIEDSATGGVDTVQSSLSWTLGANLENLTLLGNAGINGKGNDLNNVITGNAAANVLNGMAGADRMSGELGNDIYNVDNIGDVTIERSAKGGIDTVRSSVSRTLGANLEDLKLTGSALNGTGNELANVLTGSVAANVLSGGLGGDTLNGRNGSDTLQGGGGGDAFLFDTALNGKSNVDQLIDFTAVDDNIALDQTIFTQLSIGGLATSAFYGGVAAHDSNDRIIYNSASGNLYYDADGNGAAAQVLFAHLVAGTSLTSADFLIVS